MKLAQPWLLLLPLTVFGEEEQAISIIAPVEVEAAQKAWGDGIVRIAEKLSESPKAARLEAQALVETLYGHGSKPVLVKPTFSTSKPFRTTREGVVSSLVGGEEEFPEDPGFITSSFKWDRVRFENIGITVEGAQALAMGNSYFRNSLTGNETKLEYTFGYFRGDHEKILINLHFSSIPYQNHSNSSAPKEILEEQVRAAQKTFFDTILEIGKYYRKGWSYKEHAMMFVDTAFAYELGPVLFKPAKAKEHPFRMERAGALSYFRGLNEDYPEDEGFALKPWVKVDFDNHGLIVDRDTALATGQYTFELEDGEQEQAQYSMGFVKDPQGALRLNMFFASMPSDGKVLEFEKEEREKNLTEMNMEALQRAWCNELVQVGSSYVMKGNYRERAERFVDDVYAYSMRPVLFKPAEAWKEPFRSSRAGAVSYFGGGNNLFPEDWGFALRPWHSARFDNAAVIVHGTQGLTMGHTFLTDTTGVQLKAEYAMGFVRSAEGAIRVNMHHSTFPNLTRILLHDGCEQPITRQQVLEAQKLWSDGIVALGRYGRKMLEQERENQVKKLVGAARKNGYNRSMLWTKTNEFVKKIYGFSEGPVLMKVTEATPSTRIRLTRAGAISWLIGNDRDFPADRGFVLRPWNEVRFENKAINIHLCRAQAIGTAYFTDDAGNDRELQYVIGYIRDVDGRIRVDLHHMALPFGQSYQSMWDDVAATSGGVAHSVGNMARGVGSAVGGAFGVAAGGGTQLVVSLGVLGAVAGFIYFFVFGAFSSSAPSAAAWGGAAAAGTGMMGTAGYPAYAGGGSNAMSLAGYQASYAPSYQAYNQQYSAMRSGRASDRDVAQLLSAS